MAEKDFYKILGVDKKASDEEIHKSYRKLAAKWHPDKFATKSDAEKKEADEKMKEINEAYETLSDKDKRAAYDNPNPFGNGGSNPFGGGNPFGGNPFGDFGDMFSSMFGGKRTTATNCKGSDIRINLRVNLDEILNKTLKKVKYKRTEGSGETCSCCGGSGRSVGQRGGMVYSTTCRNCMGTGIEMRQVDHECEFTLNGVDDTYEVNFDEGSHTVSFMKVVEGEGNSVSSNKSQNGNLIVIVRFNLPNDFTLDTATDITKVIEVPVLKAMLGGEQEVETITGTKLNAKIPSGISDGMKIRFGGKGLQSNGHFGNMYGLIKIKMPKSLTDEEKGILSQLKDKPNFK